VRPGAGIHGGGPCEPRRVSPSSRPVRIEPKPGQESVWDYPRPPRVEPSSELVEIELGGQVVASSTTSWRVLETSHPPTYYLPAEAFDPDVLVPAEDSSFCEWKGAASWFDLVAGETVVSRAAWTYRDPAPGCEAIAGAIAVMAGRVERCLVDGEVVRPQPGAFYGGWVTDSVVGPFKGDPGTLGW
jgi:uncharacterized protein (DUF427 family)